MGNNYAVAYDGGRWHDMTIGAIFERCIHLIDMTIDAIQWRQLHRSKPTADEIALIAKMESLMTIVFMRIPSTPNFPWSGDKAQAALFYKRVREAFNPNGKNQ